jgi:hypothetical protein
LCGTGKGIYPPAAGKPLADRAKKHIGDSFYTGTVLGQYPNIMIFSGYVNEKSGTAMATGV